MQSRRVFIAAALCVGSRRRFAAALMLVAAACSSGSHDGDTRSGGAGGQAAQAGDDARIVPEGLRVMALAGGNGVLEVTAITLRKGPSNLEVYAALKNGGEIPACSAAFSIELYDKAEHSVASGIGGLLTQHFYRRTDGSGAIAACAGPGDVVFAAVTDLPADIAVEDVGTIVYRCPYFALDVVAIDGLDVGEVKKIAHGNGAAYTGTLVNKLDVAVSKPSVTVFPVNRVGRPLGVAIGTGTDTIPPGGKWVFETNTVDVPAVDYPAYPAGALAKSS